MYQSALPAKQKRETILQEGLRRLRNCSPDLEENEVIEIMSTFMNMLRISGYNQAYRYQMLKGIMERRRQINAEVLDGPWKGYRSKVEILEAKKSKLQKFPNTWFMASGAINTLKVVHTPNSTLKQLLQNKLGGVETLADGGPTKVIEMGGNLITSGLNGFENFGGQGSCHMGDACFMDKEEDCRTSRSVYCIECQVI